MFQVASICSTVVEWATQMQVYAGSSPTSADHHRELISALFCSLNYVKNIIDLSEFILFTLQIQCLQFQNQLFSKDFVCNVMQPYKQK